MQQGINMFIKYQINANFPYPRIMGDYTEEQYRKYSKLSDKLRPAFWIMAFVYCLSFAIIFMLAINEIYVYSWSQIMPNEKHYLYFSFYTFLNGSILASALSFPFASIITLKLLYPLEYRSILDFISVSDKIDNDKLAKWMLKWFSIAGIVCFIYGAWSGILVRSDHVYIKTFASLPNTIYYNDIEQVVDYRYPPKFTNNTDTGWTDHYWLKLKNEKRIDIEIVSGYDDCAKEIAKHVGKPIMYLKLN